MRKYKTCPRCGAHLDHGESCDCIKRAAPGVATTENGKSVCSDTEIISRKRESVNAEICEIRNICRDLTEAERLELLAYAKRLKAAELLHESGFEI